VNPALGFLDPHVYWKPDCAGDVCPAVCIRAPAVNESDSWVIAVLPEPVRLGEQFGSPISVIVRLAQGPFPICGGARLLLFTNSSQESRPSEHELKGVPGIVSHLDLDWEEPDYAGFMERICAFCRLIRFDKRGTGLSDRVTNVASLEERTNPRGPAAKLAFHWKQPHLLDNRHLRLAPSGTGSSAPKPTQHGRNLREGDRTMRQLQIKKNVKREPTRDDPLPLDPRDADVVRAKQRLYQQEGRATRADR